MPILVHGSLALLVGVAATYDIRFRKIPNWLNLCALIAAFGLNVFFLHIAGIARAGEGMLLALAIYFPLYLLRGMGAGDVKLMAAVGALVGPGNWLEIFIATALVGGAAAALLVLIKGRCRDTLCNLYFLLKDLACLRAPYRTNPQLDFRSAASLSLPHGVAIALGSLTFLASVIAGKQPFSTLLARCVTGIFCN